MQTIEFHQTDTKIDEIWLSVDDSYFLMNVLSVLFQQWRECVVSNEEIGIARQILIVYALEAFLITENYVLICQCAWWLWPYEGYNFYFKPPKEFLAHNG